MKTTFFPLRKKIFFSCFSKTHLSITNLPSFTTQSYFSPKETFILLSNPENSGGHSFYMYLDALLHQEAAKDGTFLLASEAAVAAVQLTD